MVIPVIEVAVTNLAEVNGGISRLACDCWDGEEDDGRRPDERTDT